MKTNATYFVNDESKPLRYGEINLINPARQRLRGEEQKDGVEAIPVFCGFCGIDKLMWGSDYPRTMVEITYKMSFDFIVKSKEMTESEKSKFLFENAKSFYGFENLSECPEIPNML